MLFWGHYRISFRHKQEVNQLKVSDTDTCVCLLDFLQAVSLTQHTRAHTPFSPQQGFRSLAVLLLSLHIELNEHFKPMIMSIWVFGCVWMSVWWAAWWYLCASVYLHRWHLTCCRANREIFRVTVIQQQQKQVHLNCVLLFCKWGYFIWLPILVKTFFFLFCLKLSPWSQN